MNEYEEYCVLFMMEEAIGNVNNVVDMFIDLQSYAQSIHYATERAIIYAKKP